MPRSFSLSVVVGRVPQKRRIVRGRYRPLALVFTIFISITVNLIQDGLTMGEQSRVSLQDVKPPETNVSQVTERLRVKGTHSRVDSTLNKK